MSSETLTYLGYSTKPKYSVEDGVIFGKIEGVSDLVDFECESTCPKDVEAAFHEAVDDYLETCKAIGKSPDKPYKGSFNVRIDPALHRKLDQNAYQDGISMNQMLENIIRWYFVSGETAKRGEEIGNASMYPHDTIPVWNLDAVKDSPAYNMLQKNLANNYYTGGRMKQ